MKKSVLKTHPNFSVQLPFNSLNENQSRNIFFISSLIIFIALSAISFQIGIASDEVEFNMYGEDILKYYISFGQDKSALSTKYIYSEAIMRYYGAFFILIATIFTKISPFDNFTTIHLTCSWFAFTAIFMSGKVVSKFFNYQWAVIAIWLFSLSPFFLGHSINNTKDIPFAAAFITSIYFILVFFTNYPNVKMKDYIWVIASIGATISIRVGGILLIPYMFVFVLINFFITKFIHNEKARYNTYIMPLILISVFGYLAGSIFWPFALQNPIQNPIKALVVFTDLDKAQITNISQLYFGQKVFANQTPFFIIINILITNTIPVLIGLISILIWLHKIRFYKYFNVIVFLVFISVFPIGYAFYKKSVVYHAWRHFLFVAPSLIVLATIGWILLAEYIQSLKFFKIKNLVIYFLLILFIEPLYFIISSFPYTVTYHNIFVGGTKSAYTNFEFDYFGNSLKEEAEWFIKNEIPNLEKNKQTVIVSNYSFLLKEYFADYPNIKVIYARFGEKNNQFWDYAIFHIGINMPSLQLKNRTWMPSNTPHISKIYDCPLSITYKRPSFDDFKGVESMNKNQLDSALIYFNRYLLIEPNDVYVMNQIASIYNQSKRYRDAVFYLNKSFSLDSLNGMTNLVMGLVNLNQNKFQEALKNFNVVLKLNPNHSDTHYFMGICYANLNRINEAMNSLINCKDGNHVIDAHGLIQQINIRRIQ